MRIFIISFILALATLSNTTASEYLVKTTKSPSAKTLSVAVSGTGQVTMDRAFDAKDLKLARETGLDRWFVIRGNPSQNALAALQANPAFEVVEQASALHLANNPNDPFFGQQYHLRNTGQSGGTAGADIDAVRAWGVTTGNSSVVIAIIDTGIDPNHPDLAPQLVPGRSFAPNDPTTDDIFGHGTSCAGIASARGNNGIGISGVSWNCSLMPIKVIQPDDNNEPEGSSLWLAQAITWAADNGVSIISMSLSTTDTVSLRNAVNYANNRGVIMVAASGNEGQEKVIFPGGYNSVICVGATNRFDQRTWFSNHGSHLDVVAPGESIFTTARQGGYTSSFTGTSAATPVVTGIAGLLKSANPGLTPAQFRQHLRQGAEDLLTPGFDIFTGFGRANAFRSLMAMQDTTSPTTPVVFTANGYTGSSNSIQFGFTASSDPESGIRNYQYAIGVQGNPTSLRDWTLTTAQNMTASNLNLIAGQSYIVSVRARNEANLVSVAGVSPPVIYAPTVQSIGDARNQPAGSYITLNGRLVSGSLPHRTWIQDPDRNQVLALNGTFALAPGDIVSVSGKLALAGGILELDEAGVVVQGNMALPPAFGVNPGLLKNGMSPGLLLTGRLVRTWGVVSSSSASEFELEYGTGQNLTVKTLGMASPATGTFVEVTGIPDPGTVNPNGTDQLWIRGSLDVRLLN